MTRKEERDRLTLKGKGEESYSTKPASMREGEKEEPKVGKNTYSYNLL